MKPLTKATYSVAETAEVLDLPEKRVRRLLADGVLRGYKVGRVITISASAIEDFHAGSNMGPDAAKASA